MFLKNSLANKLTLLSYTYFIFCEKKFLTELLRLSIKSPSKLFAMIEPKIVPDINKKLIKNNFDVDFFFKTKSEPPKFLS